jgi:23S rRNA-/tRNA-specific pseudouridylate synthase
MIFPRPNSFVLASDSNRNHGCRRTALVILSLVVSVQCLLSRCTISIGTVSAFSASANAKTKPQAKENKHNYDASSIREAREKFDAWGNANPNNTNMVRDYIVREEDLRDACDNNNNRSSRICHFAARVFSDSLPTPNAANLACSKGIITLNNNDTKVSGGRILREGDVITYNGSDRSDRRTALPSDPLRAERFCASRLRLLQTLGDEGLSHSPLRILYEDRCMAIVCKPAGIHTMSWSGSFGKCLCLDEILPLILTPPEDVAAASGDDETEDEEGVLECDEGLPAPLPRHRLDHRVAGPVVVAKTRRASVEIGRAFEEKTVTKEYRAIVVGDIEMDAIAKLDGVSNITLSSSSTISFTICSDVDGKTSETYVQVVERTPCNVNGCLTDLKLFPRTGRKHQLRIHCAQVLGTPILGDDLYWDCHETNNKQAEVGVSVRKRQGLYLFCKKVSIDHPLLGSQKVVSAEIKEPLRFTRTRTKARKGFEWSRAHAEKTARDETSNQKDDVKNE